MRLLHTDSSCGWGGQEMRILKEAEGMRKRGHEIVFAIQKGGKLIVKARDSGFVVYEVNFKKMSALKTIYTLLKVCKKHMIDLVNTHSSMDAWIGGIAARLATKKILRTRHLSTPIRKGLNSRFLYKGLADFVVTTSSSILSVIQHQANLSPEQLQCIPTGIDPTLIGEDQEAATAFRTSLGLASTDILVGTACFVRSWKGIQDLLQAAVLLKHRKEIKWVVVGGGHVDDYRGYVEKLGLEGVFTFTGHLENPYPAIQAMDIFTLLSTAHEGISQASLQAAYLQRPLITTTVGGLPEVCLHERTGYVVLPSSPLQVAQAVEKLADSASMRAFYGKEGKALVEEKFLFSHTLDAMQGVYTYLTH